MSEKKSSRKWYFPRLAFCFFAAAAAFLPSMVCHSATAMEDTDSFARVAVYRSFDSWLDAVAIDNFFKASEGVYRSARPPVESIPQLKNMGLATIVDLEEMHVSVIAEEKKAAEANGIRFFEVPMVVPSTENVQAALAIVADPSNQPVLVHCLSGKDRTGVVIAGYHVKFDHWTIDAAIREMHNYGHVVVPDWLTRHVLERL